MRNPIFFLNYQYNYFDTAGMAEEYVVRTVPKMFEIPFPYLLYMSTCETTRNYVVWETLYQIKYQLYAKDLICSRKGNLTFKSPTKYQTFK